ncbi:Uncharacterized protein DAT39_017071 [Clarias magur]|uniref:Uncharacterized protein n=1 Tax=Clarias magur TaxID=1594786 RepID=A0A8J4TAY8_CLAMG|nr:Uncharacterized protein DAT39_017071 [Clarias magur]
MKQGVHLGLKERRWKKDRRKAGGVVQSGHWFSRIRAQIPYGPPRVLYVLWKRADQETSRFWQKTYRAAREFIERRPSDWV